MKQLLYTLVVLLCSTATIYAQDGSSGNFPVPGSKWIGGSFNLNVINQDDESVHRFTIAPQFGKMISDRTLIGVATGYFEAENFGRETSKQYLISLFARSIAMKTEKLGLFAQYGFGYSKSFNGPDFNNFTIGVQPGIQYALSDRFQLEAIFGFLGYSRSSSNGFSTNNYEIDFSTTSINFGFNYLF